MGYIDGREGSGFEFNTKTKDENVKTSGMRNHHKTNSDECQSVCGLNFMVLATFIFVMAILFFRIVSKISSAFRSVRYFHFKGLLTWNIVYRIMKKVASNQILYL